MIQPIPCVQPRISSASSLRPPIAVTSRAAKMHTSTRLKTRTAWKYDTPLRLGRRRVRQEPAQHVARRHRPCDGESLDVVAAEPDQPLRDALVLHTLGHRLEAEVAREVDDRPD